MCIFFVVVLIVIFVCVIVMVSDLILDDSICFDVSLDELCLVFDVSCVFWEVVMFNFVELLIVQIFYVQVNCQGFRYVGGNCLVEFVFVDDSMVFVWVLIDVGELDGFVQDMCGVYGVLIYDIVMFIVFVDYNVVLCCDIFEFFFYLQSIVFMYCGWFDQMVV